MFNVGDSVTTKMLTDSLAGRDYMTSAGCDGVFAAPIKELLARRDGDGTVVSFHSAGAERRLYTVSHCGGTLALYHEDELTAKHTPGTATKPDMDNFVIVLVGDRWWSRGATVEEALAKAREGKLYRGRPTPYLVYAGHPKTTVSGAGDLCFPAGCQPRLLQRVGFAVQGAKKKNREKNK